MTVACQAAQHGLKRTNTWKTCSLLIGLRLQVVSGLVIPLITPLIGLDTPPKVFSVQCRTIGRTVHGEWV